MTAKPMDVAKKVGTGWLDLIDGIWKCLRVSPVHGRVGRQRPAKISARMMAVGVKSCSALSSGLTGCGKNHPGMDKPYR